MSFSEQPPSKQWAALKYRGQKFAEVWFKPEGEPFGLTFRIPSESFHIPGMGAQLTIENLLVAVGIGPHEVESSTTPDLGNALPPPHDGAHLDISVRLKPPSDAVGREESGDLEVTAARWRDLETCWKAILNLEAAMETMRINMEGLLIEVENLWKRPMTMEEKTYAPRADVALWTKAKNRVHNAVPRMKDFVHRSVWSLGSPERKRLEEIYNDHIQPHIPLPQLEDVLKQLEAMRKDRQILAAHGKTIYQECKGISAELQAAMRALHQNAAKAQRKKDATSKGRFH